MKGSPMIESTARDILNSKGSEVYHIQKDATVYDAIVEMQEKGVGALVVKEGESVAGIITERDYLRKVMLQDRSSKTTPVNSSNRSGSVPNPIVTAYSSSGMRAAW